MSAVHNGGKSKLSCKQIEREPLWYFLPGLIDLFGSHLQCGNVAGIIVTTDYRVCYRAAETVY